MKFAAFIELVIEMC